MTSRPAATVVIPTCNRAGLLSLTLRSVLAQRDVDIDVIVVDDGDGRQAPELVHAIGDPRVQVIHNRGPHGEGGARNRGLARAEQEWVAFCDDDDLWAPEKLSAQLSAAIDDGARWVYGGYVTVNAHLRILSGAPPAAPDQIMRDLSLHNSVPAGASNVVVHVDALSRAGPFDTGLRTSVDWDMWLRVARAAGHPACVPRPLVALRIHPQMMSRRAELFLADLDEIAHRHRIPVDRARHYRWAAWKALEDGRRGSAVRHYVRAVTCGDWRSTGRAIVAILAPGVTRRRRISPNDPWIREAQTWLDALRQSEAEHVP